MLSLVIGCVDPTKTLNIKSAGVIDSCMAISNTSQDISLMITKHNSFFFHLKVRYLLLSQLPACILEVYNVERHMVSWIFFTGDQSLQKDKSNQIYLSLRPHIVTAVYKVSNEIRLEAFYLLSYRK